MSKSREEKEQLLMALKERERRQAAAPLIYWKPHPGQDRAFQALIQSRIVILHPGNRFGKSVWNAVCAVCHLYGYWVFMVPGLKLDENGDYPPRESVPSEYWCRRGDGLPLLLPNKHLAATGLPARQGILSTMWPKIEELLPPAVRAHPNFRVNRGAQSVPLVLRFPPELNTRGGEVHFASGEQDPMAYEGQSFGSCGVDEPMPRKIWGALWRGMTDRMAKVWFSMTPWGPNAPWIYEEFIMKGDNLQMRVQAVGGSIHENPHLTDQSKREFLEGGNFTEEEREARESGGWSLLSHRAFPQYDASMHVVPSNTPVPPGSVIGVACDPAHRRPFFIVWGAWHSDGELLIYDEWPNEDHHMMRTSPYIIPDYARIIRNKEQGCRIDYRQLDPRFGQASPRIKGEVHTSIQEDFAKEGIYWDTRMDGCEREEIGIERIRQMLSWNKEAPISPWNRPKLRVRANCTNIINALAYSSFATSRDPDALPEKTAERYKDARDALRYLVLYPWLPRSAGDGPSYISDEDLERHNNDDWWA